MDKTLLSIQDASKFLKVSTKTLRRWEASGLLLPLRTNGGHRRYILSELKWVKRHGIKANLRPKSAPVAPPTPVIAAPAPIAVTPQIPIVEQPLQEQPTNASVPYYQEISHPVQQKRSFKALPSIAIVILTVLSISAINQFLIPNLPQIIKIPVTTYEVVSQKVKLGLSHLLPKAKDPQIVAIKEKAANSVLAEQTTFESLTLKINVPSVFEEDITINADLLSDLESLNVFNQTVTTLAIGGEATTITLGATTGTTQIANNLDVNGTNNDIAGTLNLSGNILASSADLTIDASGGGVKIGTGTQGSVDLTGDDLYITGDLEIDGTAYIPTLSINSDAFTDLTGTGLQISSGSLQTTLGTSISTGELEDSAVTAAKIADDSILEVDLKSSNSPTNAYMLTYNSSTGGFTWTDPSLSSGAWTDDGTLVRLTTSTDAVTVGSATELAKLGIDGDTDEIQFLVQGVSGQSVNNLVVENSSGTDLFTIGSSGITSIIPSANSDALTITGTSITSANLIDIDSRNTSGTILNIAYGAATDLAGALTGQAIDFNSGNVDATNEDVTGLNVKLPTVTDTDTSGSNTITGLLVNFGAGAGINQNGLGGTLNYIAGDFRMPALTETSGTLNAYGVEVTTPSSITTGGTAYGLYVNATGVGAGTLAGLNIGTITGGSGTEYALNVASGWDAVLRVGSTTVINGSGVTQVPGGGTGAATFTTNGVLYGNSTSALGVTSAGTTGQVLVGNTGSAPTWGTISGSSCTNCLVNDPSGDQTIAPTGQDTTGLSVRQTSTASPTDDIFRVTSSDGATKYFYIDSSGNVSTGAISNTTLTLTPTSNTTALTLVGTNVTTAKNQYINTSNDSGTIYDLSYGAANTLTGSLIGANIDLSTNVTATNQSVSGQVITLPAATNTSGTQTYKGIVISGGGLNENGGTATTFTGADITIPALTETSGTLTAHGVNVTTPSSITTGGTANGYTVTATGISVGTLSGINIGTISSPGAGTEYALQIGSGWDRNLYFNDTTTSVLLANGGVITITDGTNTLCTITDSGSTGDLACTGNVTGGSAGTQGFWTRSSTTLSPATANDVVSISSNDTSNPVLTLTSTGATSNAVTLTANSLTTGSALNITSTSTPTTAASTSNGVVLNLTQAAGTNATTFTGLDVKLTNNPTVAGNTEYAGRIQNQVTANATDNAVAALLLLDNADTSTGGSTVITDALSITNSGAIASGIVDAIDASDSTIDNALNIGGNFLLGDGIRLFASSSTVWTFEDTSGNNLLVLTDNSDAGDVTITGDYTSQNASPTIFFNDGDGDDYYISVDANIMTLTNSTDTRNEILFGGSGGIDIGDNTATKQIDIGGNSSSAADTIRIATEGTAADAITIGNTHASTTVAITGGDDYSLAATGVLTLSASASQTTAIVVTDTEYTNAISLADNTITGTAYTIASTTGDITIDSADELILSDTDTIIIGGHAGAVAYNVIANSGEAPEDASIDADNDLYIGGDLEVDGTITGSFSCTDCLDFDDFADSMTLDAATDVNLSTFALTIDMDSSGDFSIRDGTTDIATFSDTGAIAFTPTSGVGITNTIAGAGNYSLTTATGTQTFTSSVVTGTTTTSGFIFDATAITTGTGMYITSDSITQGNLVDITTTGVTQTTGTLLNLSSVGTAFAGTADSGDGLLANFDWNPGSSATVTGDLFRIRLDGNGSLSSGSIFNVVDEATSLFNVKETAITSALPHSFTAAGDVVIAYDLQFTNQTASTIKSFGPLAIESGESFENNNLSINTYGTGIVDIEGSTVQLDLPGGTTDEALCGNDADATTNDVLVDDCSGAPAADYAEVYPTASDVEFGDVVVTGTKTVQTKSLDEQGNVALDGSTEPVIELVKSTVSYQNTVIGIASNNYGDFSSVGHNRVSEVDHPLPIALSGRVPVKIASSSEPIAAGDFLTTSDEPGKAMKATSSGFVIAKALDSWEPNSGKETVLVFVANIYYTATDFANANFEDRLTALENQFTLGQQATGSANLTDLTLNNLTVLADAILPDTVINGKLNIGSMVLDNINSSIDAVGVLKIQPLALDDIEFLSGLIIFDKDGNIKAQTIEVAKVAIKGASAGTSTLNANETEIFIDTDQVKSNSLVFVTPKATIAYPLAVVELQEGLGFKVKVQQSESNDIEFDWFIVDHTEE